MNMAGVVSDEDASAQREKQIAACVVEYGRGPDWFIGPGRIPVYVGRWDGKIKRVVFAGRSL